MVRGMRYMVGRRWWWSGLGCGGDKPAFGRPVVTYDDAYPIYAVLEVLWV